ncbi:MBL fold metallo-hydrolase [Mucilaginibacter sp.]|uniref:MBL fold metallo-hydrolase n=1 Tax=Mucilaginibacter sp. TaxID=1882438 RepID=UPI003568553A
MEKEKFSISADNLRAALEKGEQVLVLDVRPLEQRQEWQIPESKHLEVYEDLKSGDYSKLQQAEIPANTKVITVCAAGRISQVAASALREAGIQAFSLEGGMKAWSSAWNTARLQDEKITVIQIRRTGKGCLSYMVASDNEAIVIDASLDRDIYVKLAEENGWKIKYVLDTHIHADHLSRSLALSQYTHAGLYMPDQDKLQYPVNKVKNGDILYFGSAQLKAIHTPGHTMESMTYAVNEHYLFTGDTLFTEGVGRPDLKAEEAELKKRAGLLYQSLSKLMGMNPDYLVLPGHASKPVPFDNLVIASTLKDIKEKVPALKLAENDFIDNILSKIPPTPPNYKTIVELNLVGDTQSIDPAEVEGGANRCAIN